MQIVNEKGERLYFTEEQRKALLAAAAKAPREVRSFCSVLCFTGCRISEALALTAKSIDLSGRVIVIESLKKRKAGVRFEKFSSRRVECGMQKLLDSRQIDFRVFRIRMVAMYDQCSQREQQQGKRGVSLGQRFKQTGAPEVVT